MTNKSNFDVLDFCICSNDKNFTETAVFSKVSKEFNMLLA